MDTQSNQPTLLLRGTLIGCIALLIWANSASFASSVRNIPVFQILTIAFTVSFIFHAIHITRQHKWRVLRKTPLILVIVGVIGIVGNDMFYISAFKYAPSADVELINAFWPIMIILFSSLLPREQLTVRHIIGGLMGLTGIYILIVPKAGFAHFNPHYLIGYLLALSTATVWSIYTLYQSKYLIERLNMLSYS